MCWSLEVSVAAGTMVYVIVPLLWRRNATPRDRWNAVFLFVFGTMQWVDASLWLLSKHEDMQSCSATNKWLSRWGLTFIALEPMASLAGRALATRTMPSVREMALYVFTFALLPGIPNKVLGLMGGMCDSPACTVVTPNGHLMILAGHGSNGNQACWMKHHFFGDQQMEIPLTLRVFFLLGMVYPYLTAPKHLVPGLVHALVLTTTWTVGLLSDSHASIWCLANVAHSLVMLADPYLFAAQHPQPSVRRPHRPSITSRVPGLLSSLQAPMQALLRPHLAH